VTKSPFASLNTKEIPIPGLAGQTAVIRQLGSLRAREAWSSRHDPAWWREHGWKAEVEELERRGRGEPADPLVGFWPPAVLALGVVSWSLGPVDAATIGQLAPDVLGELAREIMRWTATSNARVARFATGHLPVQHAPLPVVRPISAQLHRDCYACRNAEQLAPEARS
jgi:hypothetical protein